MKFRVFIWDFDGTLFDSYPRITRALMKGLKDYGITADYQEVLSRVKRTLGDACARYAQESTSPDVTREALEAAYRVHAEEEDENSIRPYPGALETLRSVTEHGGINLLYTHRGETAWPVLEREGMAGLFEDGVTALDHFPAKPAPDALEYLISKHRLPKGDCVMVGDRAIDLDAAGNAGIAGALFDPEGYCDAQTPFRYASMKELCEGLILS